MADGIKIDTRAIEKHLAQARQMIPAIDDEMKKANEKSSKEFVDLAKGLVTRDHGDLAESLEYREVDDGIATFTQKGGKTSKSYATSSAWGVYGLWRWFLIEYGTVKTAAQPFINPVRRLLKRRHQRRMSTALNRAYKRAFKK